MLTSRTVDTVREDASVTLIISGSIPGWIFQVSDRLISVQNDDGSFGGVVDDARNKAILYDGRFIVAFTGRAELARERADLWLAEHMSGPLTPNDGFGDLTDALSALWRGRPGYHGHGLTVIGGGWKLNGDQRPTATLHVISNSLGPGGERLPKPATSFLWGMNEYPDQGTAWVSAEPPWLDANETEQLHREFFFATSLDDAVDACVTTIRRVADRVPAVGRDLLLSVLPLRCAFGRDVPILTGTGITDQHATFFYLPGDGADPLQYGPTAVMPGGGVLADPVVGGGPGGMWLERHTAYPEPSPFD